MIPVNRPNKDGQPSAEDEEGRPVIKENVNQQRTLPTQGGVGVSPKLEGVRTAAKVPGNRYPYGDRLSKVEQTAQQRVFAIHRANEM